MSRPAITAPGGRFDYSPPSRADALALAREPDLERLCARARELRDLGHGGLLTYSRKVFIPLTQLCRDVCHYCTFAQTPKKLEHPYMPLPEVLSVARAGAELGCKEALFTLGDKPELRYPKAQRALDEMGFATTLDYLAHAAERVFEETGLLPHLNPGVLEPADIERLRRVAPSIGLMLESASPRLCGKGGPHWGSPDKEPAVRLATLEAAGRCRVPTTSGILIGIGETRLERVESLLALRDLHHRFGHLQEIIVQNFRAKPGTVMADHPEPPAEELAWTIAVARLLFGPAMNIQAPPNLSPDGLGRIIDAGINDFGGISPLTPDYVNPEAPWPQIARLEALADDHGQLLRERLCIYPEYVRRAGDWVDERWRPALAAGSDERGLARCDAWFSGSNRPPEPRTARKAFVGGDALRRALERALNGERLGEDEIVTLFRADAAGFDAVVAAADRCRREAAGDEVSYVVTRNINYTNVCGLHCHFCAFAKGKATEDLRGAPYLLSVAEIQRRVREAWSRGATEVCLQGGIHPAFTGETYLEILHAAREAAPGIHAHAFSPQEIWHGAETLGLSLDDYLRRLADAGLATLPGTAAEILDDGVRARLCPDKVSAAQWLEVIEAAHDAGLKTTATIMFGHVDGARHWARHLLAIRDLQARTGGFTEFVPLPFVHMESPMYLRRQSRQGPTWREAVLMHAVARLALHPLVPNVQASWVKLGPQGAAACLEAGCNDLGGTLMNESISRAAGADHGQELSPPAMQALIASLGRAPRQRDTLYRTVSEERHRVAMNAQPLAPVVNSALQRAQGAQLPALDIERRSRGRPRCAVE